MNACRNTQHVGVGLEETGKASAPFRPTDDWQCSSQRPSGNMSRS